MFGKVFLSGETELSGVTAPFKPRRKSAPRDPPQPVPEPYAPPPGLQDAEEGEGEGLGYAPQGEGGLFRPLER